MFEEIEKEKEELKKKIEKLEKEIQSVVRQISKLKRKVVEKEIELVELLFNHIRKNPNILYEDDYYGLMPIEASDIYIGHWACGNSPIKVCCYNWYLDRSMDNCLFCGNPEERK